MTVVWVRGTCLGMIVAVLAVTMPTVVCFRPTTVVSAGGGGEHQATCIRRLSLSLSSSHHDTGTSPPPSSPQERPTPTMPSSLFQTLAESSLELLASALRVDDPVEAAGVSSPTSTSTQSPPASATTSKVKSMALYLPQENAQSGQLEFIPAVLYPPPRSDRVFIAADATSEGRATTLPRTLTTLPGFSQAVSLLPGYPMVRSSSASSVDGTGSDIGVVEEVLCAVDGSGAAALSVPLLAGSQTTGVLLVYPSVPPPSSTNSVWTTEDREQVARAAKTLSLALSMDAERRASAQRQQVFAQALSDSMHQVKNPLQALRTYGKLLQQQLADMDSNDTNNNQWDGRSAGAGGGTRKLLELADHLMIQGDRLTARLQPVDAILDEYSSPPGFALMPSTPLQQPQSEASTSPDKQQPPWSIPLLPPPEQQQQVPSSSSSSTNELLSYASVTQAMGASSSVLRDFDVEMTFVVDVLAPILDSFRAIAQDQGIRFDVEQGDTDDLPGVMANAEALQEAVSNVIDNAIKYVKFPKEPQNSGLTGTAASTNPSPRVKVTLRPNPQDQDIGVTILIEDNGPGIPENAKELVFQRGFRHDRTKDVGGSGIGLDIAKALVEKMGGSLDILTPGNNKNDSGALDGARLQVKLYREVK